MDWLWQDVRYGFKILLKNPGFTLTAIIALAIGIAANTAIFSLVNAVLLRPLPFKNPDKVVMLWEKRVQQGLDSLSVSSANYIDWQSRSQSFENMAAARNWNVTLTGGVGEPELLLGLRASASLFPMLGVEAGQGRLFQDDEDQPGHDRVVVLSHGFWQRRFASDPSIIGKTITLNGENHTVIGIMPPDFQFASSNVELFAPIALNTTQLNREIRSNLVFARLKPGVTMKQAQSEMDGIAAQLEQEYPKANGGYGVSVHLMHEFFANLRNTGSILIILLSAVGLLLLIGCVNVANLLLARAASRQKEIAIRTSLGATRKRMMRQLLTESVLLAMISGVLGLGLALLLFKYLVAITPYIPTFRTEAISINWQVLVFTLGVSLLTGVIFGLAPALQSSNPNLSEFMKEGGRTLSGGARSRRMRSLLVISEVALAVMLLIGAGLTLKSFLRLQEVSPGFDTSNVLSMQIALPPSKYKTPAQTSAFFKQFLERVEGLPGVRSAGVVSMLPLTGLVIGATNISIEGRPIPEVGQEFNANDRIASPKYFEAMGIPLYKGRLFNEQDDENSPGVVIINQTMAKRYWPDDDPIGKRIKPGAIDSPSPWYMVTGVVGDVRDVSLDAEPRPEMYRLYRQSPSPVMALLVRGPSDPSTLVGPIKRELRSLDNDQPVSMVMTMDQWLARSVSARRFSMLLLVMLSTVALLLAATGIYGIIAYSVVQRTQEIGLRIALGAQRMDVFKLIMGQGMTLVLIGVVVGVVAAVVLVRLMSSLLFAISSTDPAIFTSVPLLLAAVAALASYIPARRATKVDPLVALRFE
jgi:putative ABC transport system permease protein